MRCALKIGLGIVLVALAGCETRTTINGTVTYNGVPVEEGYIAFSPKGGGRGIASPIANGSYSIKDAVPGHYTAVATGSRKINHYSTSAESYANASKTGGHVAEAADYIAVEAPGNSKEVDVSTGQQTFDFAITGPPVSKK